MSRHTFRFFTQATCRVGDEVTLSESDAQHAQVIRLRIGDGVEMVDPSGSVWEARMADRQHVAITARIAEAAPEPCVELVAGVVTGHQWDELLDGAVQAGATSITPLVTRVKDADKVRARSDRSRRVVEAAARQAKRRIIPLLGDPVTIDELAAHDAGFVCVEGSMDAMPLDQAARMHADVAACVLVGPAAGLDAGDIDELIGHGWVPVTLGPTIFRTQAAAMVAVAMLRLARMA